MAIALIGVFSAAYYFRILILKSLAALKDTSKDISLETDRLKVILIDYLKDQPLGGVLCACTAKTNDGNVNLAIYFKNTKGAFSHKVESVSMHEAVSLIKDKLQIKNVTHNCGTVACSNCKYCPKRLRNVAKEVSGPNYHQIARVIYKGKGEIVLPHAA